jgi:hypothetical protein
MAAVLEGFHNKQFYERVEKCSLFNVEREVYRRQLTLYLDNRLYLSNGLYPDNRSPHLTGILTPAQPGLETMFGQDRDPYRKSLNNCQYFYQYLGVDQDEYMLLNLERLLYGEVLKNFTPGAPLHQIDTFT